MDEIFEEKLYNTVNFKKEKLPLGVYDNCIFTNCNFNEVDLSEITFLECEFNQCDLSMAKVINTSFRDVILNNCKVLGIVFNTCNPMLFKILPKNCNLNYTCFATMNLKGIPFDNCSLQEVDFTDTNLSEALFNTCDLTRTQFDNTNLTRADLRSALNYSIDPEKNTIKKAKFSLAQVSGLLEKYEIELS